MKKLNVVFFKTSIGTEPVREWLLSFNKQAKKVIGEDIMTVQYGWPLGMPLVKSLKQGLWEIRIKLPDRRIARVIFLMDDNTMVLLHGFIKKTMAIAKNDFQLALKRKFLYLAH